MSGCLGKRWMTGAKRKWFRSLFQILNQSLLQATTADINCGTCDFLLPAQIMIVWTTGALAPGPRRHRKRNWLRAQMSHSMVTRINVFINSEIPQAKQSIFDHNSWAFLMIYSCTYNCFHINNGKMSTFCMWKAQGVGCGNEQIIITWFCGSIQRRILASFSLLLSFIQPENVLVEKTVLVKKFW